MFEKGELYQIKRDKIITERCLNREFRPVINHSGRIGDFPVSFKDNGYERNFNYFIGPRNMMTLDIISDIFSYMFMKKDMKTNTQFNMGSNNMLKKYNEIGGLKTLQTVKKLRTFIIDIDNLFLKYEFIRNLGQKTILSMFTETSKISYKGPFFMRKYKVDNENGKVEIYYEKLFSDEFKNIFEIEIIEEKDSNVRKGKNYFLKLNFNSELGIIFLHNLCSMNVDWIPVKLYDLDTFSQFFFRIFIVGTMIGYKTKKRKRREIEIQINDIKRAMNIKTEGRKNVMKKLETTFENFNSHLNMNINFNIGRRFISLT